MGSIMYPFARYYAPFDSEGSAVTHAAPGFAPLQRGPLDRRDTMHTSRNTPTARDDNIPRLRVASGEALARRQRPRARSDGRDHGCRSWASGDGRAATLNRLSAMVPTRTAAPATGRPQRRLRATRRSCRASGHLRQRRLRAAGAPARLRISPRSGRPPADGQAGPREDEGRSPVVRRASER